MTARDGRLNKLYPALTARERALLILRAWKNGQDEDPQVRSAMPDAQVREFNRYIGLMNGVNVRLATYIIHLSAVVRQLGTKSGWLASLQVWGVDAWKLAAYIFLHTREPITKSEHRRLVERARSEMLPARELAEILTERCDSWTEADMVASSDEEAELVSYEAWERVRATKEKEIARLVEEGVLEGKRTRRRVVVNAGSFYDWLGEPVPVSPKWGLEFEVFPDKQADTVRRLQKERQAAREALSGAPSDSALEPVFRRFCADHRWSRETPSWGDQVADALSGSLRDGIEECWRSLGAIEVVTGEIAVEFDGEDPLLPDVRGILDDVRKELEELHPQVQAYVGEFALPEPDEDAMAVVRKIVARAAEAYCL